MIGPEVNAPDLTEAVVGYRTFRVVRNGQHNYGLESPYRRMPWDAVEMTARCTEAIKVPEGLVLLHEPRPHSAPAKNCGCGIYAYFDYRRIEKDRYRSHMHLSFGQDYGTEFVALVSLSGRIEVHSGGMRAQKGRICAIGLNANLSADETQGLCVIAEAFGVPVVEQDNLPILAPEYGRELGRDLRPKPAPQPMKPTAPRVEIEMDKTTKRRILGLAADPEWEDTRRRFADVFVIGLNGLTCLVGIGLGVFAGSTVGWALAVWFALVTGYFVGRARKTKS